MNDEEIAYMTRWAAQQGGVLTLKGEVGFGRPCVGVTVGSSYLDFLWIDMDYQTHYKDERVRAFKAVKPEDAYHKHPCLAVLVHNDDYETATRQLYDWIKAIEELGWGVVVNDRKTFNEPGTYGSQLELMMGGHKNPELRPL